MNGPKPNNCILEFKCYGIDNCIFYKQDPENESHCNKQSLLLGYCHNTLAQVNKVILFLKDVKFGKDNLLNFIKESYDGQDIPE